MKLKNIDQSELEFEASYAEDLEALQEALFRIHRHRALTGKRSIVAIEGWDAAGKGGLIRRLTEKLDLRRVQVHPIGAPTPEEQGRHYLYRFWKRVPPPGYLTIFDRTWYGRVLVERVEGFAPPKRWKAAYEEINQMERQWTDDGIELIKIFLHITPEEQLERFEKRLEDPFKRWKLTAEDMRNRAKWAEYEDAVEEMFDRTDTKHAPWFVVGANHKKSTRVRVLRQVAAQLEQSTDVQTPLYDSAFVEEVRAWLAEERAREA